MKQRALFFSVTSLLWLSDLSGGIFALSAPFVKLAIGCSYATAALVPGAYYLAYSLFALVAGRLADRIGLTNAIRVATAMGGLGSAMALVATLAYSFPMLVVSGAFVGGGAILNQIAGNSTLSSALTNTVSRLNRAHAIACLGYVVAPAIGALLASVVASPTVVLRGLYTCFFVIWISAQILPIQSFAPDRPTPEVGERWLTPILWLAAAALLFDTGVAVTMDTTLVRYFHDPAFGGCTLQLASWFAGLYYVGIALGRGFLFPYLLTRISSAALIALAVATAILGLFGAILFSGPLGILSVLISGMARSAMFPTILALELRRCGAHRGKATGFLYVSTIGASLFPYLFGRISEQISMETGLLLLTIGLAFIWIYSLAIRKRVWVGASSQTR